MGSNIKGMRKNFFITWKSIAKKYTPIEAAVSEEHVLEREWKYIPQDSAAWLVGRMEKIYEVRSHG